MNRVIWFEYPADNPEKLAQFYADVFGWTTKKWEGPVNYIFLTSGEDNNPGMNGGVFEKGDFGCPLNTIAVEDIDLYTQKVLDNGGLVHKPKVFMEGNYTIWCKDPEDNLFAIMQLKQKPVIPEIKEPYDVRSGNRPYHFEIPANKPMELADFYTNVFGWEKEMWGVQTDYVLMKTGEMNEPGSDGAISKEGDYGCVINTVIVYDLDKYLLKVEEAGGKVIQPRYKIEKIGFHAYCVDPEGNQFGILQPEME